MLPYARRATQGKSVSIEPEVAKDKGDAWGYMPLRPQTTKAMERAKKAATATQPKVMMSIGLAKQRRLIGVIPFYGMGSPAHLQQGSTG